MEVTGMYPAYYWENHCLETLIKANHPSKSFIRFKQLVEKYTPSACIFICPRRPTPDPRANYQEDAVKSSILPVSCDSIRPCDEIA
jgi:hypothetical protein